MPFPGPETARQATRTRRGGLDTSGTVRASPTQKRMYVHHDATDADIFWLPAVSRCSALRRYAVAISGKRHPTPPS